MNNSVWHLYACITSAYRLCAVVVLVAALLRVVAAAPTLAEFPFEFREGLLWIEVNTRSPRSLNCLLDTGAGRCVSM